MPFGAHCTPLSAGCQRFSTRAMGSLGGTTAPLGPGGGTMGNGLAGGAGGGRLLPGGTVGKGAGAAWKVPGGGIGAAGTGSTGRGDGGATGWDCHAGRRWALQHPVAVINKPATMNRFSDLFMTYSRGARSK